MRKAGPDTEDSLLRGGYYRYTGVRPGALK
jgi:hypothetical protein